MVPELEDVSSNANYSLWQTVHTVLDVAINFRAKALEGRVLLTMKPFRRSDIIVLDTSFLSIKTITSGEESVDFVLKKRREPRGQALEIYLKKVFEAGHTTTIEIEYATTDACTALQWLEPAQTAGKNPYMFSQNQAIHARSMFPCQDTPIVKSSFLFKLKSPYVVVATGNYKGSVNTEDGQLLYEFVQDIPIPSYLSAIASGDLATAQIGPRSTLYTEPKNLYAFATEMEPLIERFIETAESFLPKYAWTTYNTLVLPQSFPYGGMENPQISFLTPTVLAGDGSNLDVVAHELSHSWSGNLVTCAGWSHFWLNEGWTVFLERKIIEKLHGKQHAEFSAIIGWRALEDSVAQYGEKHEFTKLIPHLHDVDPDDSFSSVPYEKGFNFLYYLEGLLGAESFENFAFFYFEKFAKKSITSLDFKNALYSFYNDDKSKKILDGVNWDDRFHSPGLPPKPNFDTTLAVPCYSLAKCWIDAKSAAEFTLADVEGWLPAQFQVFLDTLGSSYFKSSENLLAMGDIYKLTETKNTEILFRYYTLGLKVKAKPVNEDVAKFLGTVGRMKYVRPLFKSLNDVDRELAKRTFAEVRNGLHPICRSLVEKDLKLK